MKIAVLVSGGVDSSVALRLLKDQGHEVTAFYLKIWLEDELSYLGTCPWQEDLAYVEALCAQLQVPLEVVSLQKEYWDRVVATVIGEIKEGRTPNPDILCNQRVKFGAFYEKIDDSYDKVATGHYAQVEEVNGVFYLKRAPDVIKDQTYFLSHLSQAQLARALFPIGHLTKPEVRELARQYDLPTKERKDSQGICFLGKLKFSDFVRHHVGDRVGSLVEYETGKVLGEHNGFWYYTIGQRQGLGLGGGPWYVVKKDIPTNTVFVSKNYYAEDKVRNTCTISGCNWITTAPDAAVPVTVKFRHGANEYPCLLAKSPEGGYRVTISTNDQGLAAGQYAVLYSGSECLGGGIINE